MYSSTHTFLLSPLSPTKPCRHRRRHRLVSSLSDPPTTSTTTSSSKANLPIRPVPGDYGPPFVGAIKDRLDYHYFQGVESFFSSRINLHNSTVLRLNMPPGPFISRDPRVVALLDAASFPVLFDTSRVEKRDVFTGTFMPSVNLTGGHRILSYLDHSEPKHALLKRFIFYLLSTTRPTAIPAFRETFGSLFSSIESTLRQQANTPQKVAFGDLNDQASFTYLARAFFGVDPSKTELGSDAPGLITKWVFLQLGPILTLGLPAILEEPLLHTFPLPSFLVKKDYDRLYSFFKDSSKHHLDEAERMGLSRDEACHNILFATCFNTFGGMKILFPAILKWVGLAGAELHRRLAEEVRASVESHGGGEVTMKAMDAMPLLKSVVYEVLRLEPPVKVQYGRAKKDMVVESHDSAFEVKKGEMLFGFQPFATRDDRVFQKAQDFVPDRFLGEEGEKLLRYVVWSNGPETENPTEGNKQCAGKNFVVLIARLLLVELFMNYDSIEVEIGTSPLGSAVNITSLKKAS